MVFLGDSRNCTKVFFDCIGVVDSLNTPMVYIGKERALKRLHAHYKQWEQRFPIEEKAQDDTLLQSLIKQVTVFPDDFLIDCFKTVNSEFVLLSSRRCFYFDTLEHCFNFAIEDIQKVSFDFEVKSHLDQPHLITLTLANQSLVPILMSDGPQGLALVSAINKIRRMLYQ